MPEPTSQGFTPPSPGTPVSIRLGEPGSPSMLLTRGFVRWGVCAGAVGAALLVGVALLVGTAVTTDVGMTVGDALEVGSGVAVEGTVGAGVPG